MTNTGSGTWLKTLDGDDVYTEDGEWFYGHEAQGWFHAPHLLTAVPAPPLRVRARDEVTRLSTGWPPFRGIFSWSKVRATGDRLYMVLWTLEHLAVVVSWIWFWTTTTPWSVAQSFQKIGMAVWMAGPGNDPLANTHGAWYHDRNDTDAHNFVIPLLLVFGTVLVWYVLYLSLAFSVDPHKGYALMVPIALVTIAGMAQRHRVSEVADAYRQARRDIE